MKIAVTGAGAWGTALALAASRHPAKHGVLLWARDAAQAQAMQQRRENARYLPGVELPQALLVQSGAAALRRAASGADLIVIATPVAGLRAMLAALRDAPVHLSPVAWLCKGFEPADAVAADQPAGLLPHEIQRQSAPGLRAGALSGPSFAQEVAHGQPAALVAASAHPEVRAALVQALHGPALRIYANSDIAGVEVGGAVKNVLAIATGLADGLQLGQNARAALVTRGLAEIARLGVAMGARAETFMGLSGLGDLVLTATGDLSRNRQVGLKLASGMTLTQTIDSLGHVAEGVYSARTIARRAAQLGVEMPITECVVALLDGRLNPAEAVVALMGRDPKGEL
ncbi:MAG: NAD(P)-dependent glycerol-3-phosphate dehydrogenase [Burkholderiaceae bacterium]|jgi:glycerol-3-phosphate dehydrogenase (NAD(P)+)|nr:NAD(P)-dependent glycerol-3-phosphate dehydrogenase [Burkholderiaceae bacterium]